VSFRVRQCGPPASRGAWFIIVIGNRDNGRWREGPMKPAAKKPQRCAIYTRVSTDNGLEQEFNSLHAQREAAQAYIKSQAHEGWKLIRDHYDDGGFPAPAWTALACRSCSQTYGSAGSTL
jgi:hypothetical protein